ncbi:hypothetical protein EVAR_96106_1 [Eumeta japonica]|uniref:Uncharacterized protein n=1 Tax=Eumeta variegata TaxID=151549 RepID=A0A4C1VE25_EUMVA|nr:hypothetical protein EVAR_96106_1 [Eumeta japonica]
MQWRCDRCAVCVVSLKDRSRNSDVRKRRVLVGIAREFLLGLVPDSPIVYWRDKFSYLEIRSSRLDYGDEFRHPSHLVPRRSETSPGKVDVQRDGYENVLGEFEDERVNKNGDCLLALCQKFNLCVTNTMFDHRRIQLYTWRRGEDKKHDRLYIVGDRLTSKVVNKTVYRGINVGIDPFLVVCQIRALCQRWRHHAKMVTTVLERIKVGKLQNQNVKDEVVSQGSCVASPWLFDLFRDRCFYDFKECELRLMMDKLSVICLLCGDDRAILAPLAYELQEMVTKINDFVKKRDIAVNIKIVQNLATVREELSHISTLGGNSLLFPTLYVSSIASRRTKSLRRIHIGWRRESVCEMTRALYNIFRSLRSAPLRCSPYWKMHSEAIVGRSAVR